MDCISPHQVPLARALVGLYGEDSFRYVYRDREQADRVRLGWKMDADESWFVWKGQDEGSLRLIRDADVLLTGMREPDTIEVRLRRGLRTLYTSERWFKPIILFSFHWFEKTVLVTVPGWVRLLRPSYFKMARRFAHMFKSAAYGYLPVGPWAEKDMRLVCKVFHVRIGTNRILPWGYFVEKGIGNREQGIGNDGQPLKVLYVGRMLALKRVDTIIRAVAYVNKKFARSIVQPSTPNLQPFCTLTLVGAGPEREHLIRMAQGMTNVYFRDSVPIEKVREVMRAHDILVFSSCGYDGWGAVVSEALEEGLVVYGTEETGSSVALLPKECRFGCGDWRHLARLLSSKSLVRPDASVLSQFSAAGAAKRLRAFLEEMQ